MPDEFDIAMEFAHSRMADAGNDLNALPVPLQTAIRIETMQGIIDNGGLQYFFENDFPNNPPYSVFVNDLLRINAVSQAKQLQASIDCLDLTDPHLNREQRNQRLTSLWAEENTEFINAENQLCGNEDIWVKLRLYTTDNIDVFRPNTTST